MILHLFQLPLVVPQGTKWLHWVRQYEWNINRVIAAHYESQLLHPHSELWKAFPHQTTSYCDSFAQDAISFLRAFFSQTRECPSRDHLARMLFSRCTKAGDNYWAVNLVISLDGGDYYFWLGWRSVDKTSGSMAIITIYRVSVWLAGWWWQEREKEPYRTMVIGEIIELLGDRKIANHLWKNFEMLPATIMMMMTMVCLMVLVPRMCNCSLCRKVFSRLSVQSPPYWTGATLDRSTPFEYNRNCLQYYLHKSVTLIKKLMENNLFPVTHSSEFLCVIPQRMAMMIRSMEGEFLPINCKTRTGPAGNV